MIPQLISDHFEPMHIELVFRELHTRFGFNEPAWKKKFHEYLTHQPRTTSEMDAFIKFGNSAINPVLNAILCRNSLHSTFVKMLYYVVEKNSVGAKSKRR
ncbi:MAG: hypothetical protein SH819_04060 [Cytophagales bacterium]|nr:hypothetical protein [Cytophagales bacterium]